MKLAFADYFFLIWQYLIQQCKIWYKHSEKALLFWRNLFVGETWLFAKYRLIYFSEILHFSTFKNFDKGVFGSFYIYISDNMKILDSVSV